MAWNERNTEFIAPHLWASDRFNISIVIANWAQMLLAAGERSLCQFRMWIAIQNVEHNSIWHLISTRIYRMVWIQIYAELNASSLTVSRHHTSECWATCTHDAHSVVIYWHSLVRTHKCKRKQKELVCIVHCGVLEPQPRALLSSCLCDVCASSVTHSLTVEQLQSSAVHAHADAKKWAAIRVYSTTRLDVSHGPNSSSRFANKT